jgi:diguanylate cyclase (GGDEF)-like protein
MEALPDVMTQVRAQGDSLALLFIDLDGFKQLNDSLGHEAGDQLLEAVAERLRGAVRASDAVFRLAGDEFTVLLKQVKNLGHARLAAEKVLEAINRPIAIEHSILHMQASIGVALFDESVACSATQLLKQADSAMYVAKRSGRNRVHTLEAHSG